jgi:hypothetical protein
VTLTLAIVTAPGTAADGSDDGGNKEEEEEQSTNTSNESDYQFNRNIAVRVTKTGTVVMSETYVHLFNTINNGYHRQH